MIPDTPLLTVDALIINKDHEIVMIKRKNPPYGWALPGGFVDKGETVEHAVAREVKEETDLDVYGVSLFGVYSDPQRDKRGHTVSIVFVCKPKNLTELKGKDDAELAGLFRLDDLPPNIAFDHGKIISDYLERKNEFV